MVEVVMPRADSEECGDHVVTGSMLVIKQSLAEPVHEWVYTEHRLREKSEDYFLKGKKWKVYTYMVNKDETSDTCIDKFTFKATSQSLQ